MKKYIRNAVEALDALGCRLDHADRELRPDRWIFSHPSTPDETFKIAIKSSETACRTVVQRAKVAAGLATSESAEKRKPKVNARAKAEREAERLRRNALAAAKEAERIRRDNLRILEDRRRQVAGLDRMMRGTSTRGATPLPADVLFTPTQMSCELEIPEAAIKQAIDDEVLDAYMCAGGVIKVKGGDATAWARARRKADSRAATA